MEVKAVIIHGVVFEHHIDGLWNTSRYQVGEDVVIVKSRQGKGVKFHILEAGQVVKTFRFTAVPFGKLDEVVTKYYKKWQLTKQKKAQAPAKK